MSEFYRQCPKCGHVLPQAMPASAQCPACGIYFFKWGQSPARRDRTPEPGKDGLLQSLLMARPEMDATTFYGRCVALVLLAGWSWTLIGYDYRDGGMFASFMHNILLPIHEAGHVFLIPCGEFMAILGGSLLQLLLPLGIAVAFVVKYRDNFAAAICLWWTGVSLLDLAPYIYDSRHPQLTMLGGHTGENGPHDWIYLLEVFGQLHRAQQWGATAHALAALVTLFALAWAAIILRRQKALLDA